MSDDAEREAAQDQRIADLEQTVAMLVGELNERKPGWTEDARKFWIPGAASVAGCHFERTR